jgi:ribA/ribD-fused uncharacterized protein
MSEKLRDANSIIASERTYRREDCVVFYRTREAFGGLSNMAAGYPLRVVGISVFTSEALYQACRFPHLPAIQKEILRQTSPMTAKMKSKPHRKDSRADWDDVRVAIMKWCLKVKLVQHWVQFGDLLLSTGSTPIVEQSRKDRFWGAVPGPDNEILRGSNVLGRLLMDLRERIKKDADEFFEIRPVPIPDFLLLGREITPVFRQIGEVQRLDQDEERQREFNLHQR